MWLCFNNAFVSVVEMSNDPSKLMVRARKREHLVNLFGPTAQIKTSYHTDYKYRVFVDRSDFAKFLSSKVMEINYSNFKDSVKDVELKSLYGDFWFQHWSMQQEKNEDIIEQRDSRIDGDDTGISRKLFRRYVPKKRR